MLSADAGQGDTGGAEEMGDVASRAARVESVALAALLLGAAAIAFAPLLVRWSELGPTATGFHRMALAVPMLWAWTIWRGEPLVPRAHGGSTRDTLMLAATGIFFALDLICLHWSIALTSVANSILFLNAQPIYVVIAAWLLFREKVTPIYLAGLALALIGAVLLMGRSAEEGADRLLGDALGVMAGVFYAGYILVAVRLRARYSSLPVMVWTSLAAAPVLLAASLVAGESVLASSWQGWYLLLALAFVAQVAGNGLIVYGLAHLPAAFSAVSLLSAPVFAAMFAWVLLAEPLGVVEALGMAVLLAGIGLAWRGRAVKRA